MHIHIYVKRVKIGMEVGKRTEMFSNESVGVGAAGYK